MSEQLIATLQDQLRQLQAENLSLKTEAKERRIKGKKLQAENEKFAQFIEDLAAERDDYKARLEAAPGDLQKKVDELTGQIRARAHRDKFNALAKSEDVTNERALEDLWTASGYRPESDEPDEGALKAAIGKALQGRDYLKTPPAPDGANGRPADAGTKSAQGAAPVSRDAGPGASRGGGPGKGGRDELLAEKYPNAFRLA